ncbi:MAG TPA: RodZ domain-containing protein [Bryobacteraceae bacterium]|nr:RodZ domain-containing protein [Bryobacteraceae bacterium]
MNSIGETLRNERQRRKLDLDQVARETKISRKLLEAIEAEDFAKLPGGVFTKSFVRQYARVLGLDEDEIGAELQRTIEPPAPLEADSRQAPPQPAFDVPRVPDFAGSSPRSNSMLPALAGMVIVMLVCSGVYVLWQKSRRAAPVTPAAPVAARVENQAPPASVPAPVAPPVQPAVDASAGVQPVAAPVPAPEGAVAPAASLAERAADPNANVRVAVTATEPTWISARADGQYVYSGTLQVNETKELSASEMVRLIVGNAGGISITLNGKLVPAVGPAGQVRVVQFSPGGVQIVPRKPLAPAPDTL